ncbi:hypothetical protein P8891_06350 [Bacillus atrophaeus]|uniref:hypothetical protein n=1 Tax=Bacillus atrophaeus TaxID=1452 RepID=UPI00227F9F0F|nr:hypothetical protein [Bacillus atrophaeus]MCY7947999.1 hypothetical protein [Bacillus atrophaeus]MEC0740705.1 hypothetical protein [Bacillus atrophaeus]MEC0915854.1 hypothetical protein [Bacillus atrophaeus]
MPPDIKEGKKTSEGFWSEHMKNTLDGRLGLKNTSSVILLPTNFVKTIEERRVEDICFKRKISNPFKFIGVNP